MLEEVENYVVLTESDDFDFETKVNYALKEGYRLIGIPLISVDIAATSENPAQYRYQQALVKFIESKS